MKKLKKFTAMLLTLVMSLALAVPCFAAEPKSTGNAIWVKAGETITVDGVSIEFQTGDAAVKAMDAARSPRAGKTYFDNHHVRGTEWFGNTINCQPRYGENLRLELNNVDKNDIVMNLWIDGEELLFYCEGNKPSIASFYKEGGLTCTVSWSIYPADTSISTYMNYYFSAYQS